MKEYELTNKDTNVIYESAVREFYSSSVQYKQQYSNFLTHCMLKSMLAFMQAKGIEAKEGKLYVTKEVD